MLLQAHVVYGLYGEMVSSEFSRPKSTYQFLIMQSSGGQILVASMFFWRAYAW